MVKSWAQGFLTSLVRRERSAKVLAASTAVGAYIAFSPFIFFHTFMALVFVWFFPLNLAVVLIVSNLINNPWSMVPVYTAGYVVGDWLLRGFCSFDPLTLNPSWMATLNEPLQRWTGIEGISFWSFMLGGNLLGLLAAGILYWSTKPIFIPLTQRIYDNTHGN